MRHLSPRSNIGSGSARTWCAAPRQTNLSNIARRRVGGRDGCEEKPPGESQARSSALHSSHETTIRYCRPPRAPPKPVVTLTRIDPFVLRCSLSLGLFSCFPFDHHSSWICVRSAKTRTLKWVEFFFFNLVLGPWGEIWSLLTAIQVWMQEGCRFEPFYSAPWSPALSRVPRTLSGSSFSRSKNTSTDCSAERECEWFLGFLCGPAIHLRLVLPWPGDSWFTPLPATLSAGEGWTDTFPMKKPLR